eukprot:11851598-Alexandrium_andersonii.AAC.1
MSGGRAQAAVWWSSESDRAWAPLCAVACPAQDAPSGRANVWPPTTSPAAIGPRGPRGPGGLVGSVGWGGQAWQRGRGCQVGQPLASSRAA